jgi:hypothetical protein
MTTWGVLPVSGYAGSMHATTDPGTVYHAVSTELVFRTQAAFQNFFPISSFLLLVIWSLEESAVAVERLQRQ